MDLFAAKTNSHLDLWYLSMMKCGQCKSRTYFVARDSKRPWASKFRSSFRSTSEASRFSCPFTDEPAASPRRLIMTPRSALQSSHGSRPQTSSQSVAGRRTSTSSPVTTSEDGSVDGGQKNRRPSGRSSSGLLYRSPYAAESAGVLKKPSRHAGGNAPLPTLPVASRPSTAASAAKPQNFDFGGLTPR